MNNMQQIFSQAHKLQAKIAKAQAELENKEVTGTAGSNAVQVVITLKGEMKSIQLDKTIIDPGEKEMLEDLILTAFRDAKQKADKMFEEGMKQATGGMDLSKFGGLF